MSYYDDVRIHESPYFIRYENALPKASGSFTKELHTVNLRILDSIQAENNFVPEIGTYDGACVVSSYKQ